MKVYSLKDYTEQDAIRAIPIWRIGGVWLAEIAHHMLGLPGMTTIWCLSTTIPIIASTLTPIFDKVQKNMQACFAGMEEALKASLCIHQVLMFDELATEKWIWVNQNKFLRLAQEDAGSISMEFASESDLDELAMALGNSDVCDACEVSHLWLWYRIKLNFPFRQQSAHVESLPLRPGCMVHVQSSYISGTCKQENAGAHTKLLSVALKGVNNEKLLTKLWIVSIASDSEYKHGWAINNLTAIHLLEPMSNIYQQLNPLVLMDFHVGEDNLTADKDPKHIFKHWQGPVLCLSGMMILGTHITLQFFAPIYRKPD